MSVLIWILILVAAVALLFLTSMALWYLLPVILFVWLIWWIGSLFRPKRKKQPNSRVYFYTNMNPDDLYEFMNGKDPAGSRPPENGPLQLRAPLEDSIDAEYSEEEQSDDSKR